MSDNSFASRARASQSNSIQSILDGNNKENSAHSANSISDIANNKTKQEEEATGAHILLEHTPKHK